MSLIALLAVLVLMGAVLFFINTLPIDQTIKRICFGVIVLFAVVWVLQAIGVLPNLGAVRVR